MPDENAPQNKDNKDIAALAPEATQDVSDVQAVVFGSEGINGKNQTELLNNLIAPSGRSFDQPPEFVVDEKTGRTEVLECESYFDPADNRVKFFVRNNDLYKVANIDPNQLNNRNVRGGRPFGINAEVKESGSLHINIKPTKVTVWRKIRAFGLLNAAEILHNGYDVTTRWKNALSKVSVPKKEADGSLSFVLSEDNLRNLKPVDKACLLGNVSDNKEAADLIRNSKSLSAYSSRDSVARESLRSYGRMAGSVLNASILGIPRMFASMLAKGSVTAGFKTLFLDTIKFPRDVLGLKDLPKRVVTLTGLNRFKYIASKLVTAPLNLVGGAVVDNKYYEVLLRRECRKDLQKMAGAYSSANAKNPLEKSLEHEKQKQQGIDDKGQGSKTTITKMDKKSGPAPAAKTTITRQSKPENQPLKKNEPQGPQPKAQDAPKKEQTKKRIQGSVNVLPESLRNAKNASIDTLDKKLSELADKLSMDNAPDFDGDKKDGTQKALPADIESVARNMATMKEAQEGAVKTTAPGAATRIGKRQEQGR